MALRGISLAYIFESGHTALQSRPGPDTSEHRNFLSVLVHGLTALQQDLCMVRAPLFPPVLSIERLGLSP